MTIRKAFGAMFFKAANVMALATTGVSLTDLRLGAFLAGGPTFSGQTVTVDAAIQLDTVWACVRLLSETIASLPLKLYERQPNETSIVARNHPLFSVLATSPNADMTPIEFWGTMVACLVTWGNAFGQVMRRGDGSVIAINPLRPDRMTVRRDPNSGALTYTYAWQGKYLVLAEADIFHIKGFSFDGLLGLSPISVGRQSIGTALAAEQTAGKTFKNGLLTQSYISAPDYLKDPEKERAKAILADYAGAINAGKTPLLEGGWKVESIGLNPEDMQLLQTRGFNVETLCRWFAVPPVMIGRMEKSTAWGSGLEQMNLWFLQYGLMPWLIRIEQAITRCLLSPADRLRFYAKHNVDALMRGDTAARTAFYVAGLQNGFVTANEVRARENLPPDPDGNVLCVQAQMIPRADIGKAAVQPTLKPVPGGQPPPDPPQPDSTGSEDDD
ncbi:phage major capsid protein HK97 [Acetobacter nitrogenifigens DSM 23921 = NBRC 105050]|uniref:Phage portal protein n=1 Tax=Acetobacter nitrogenifigens DSM 23921 = NBRC 105050 TaxID=1120919 RepID=A0A511XFK0_9PROT|nr:phage portal protein [Acetobacter nitrogenifigens]GBQ90256.1 phage major capsid protein HK97 [Acetobacter nitrogenifigens DSM 23921 = NBRC 105050]GEN61736.1 phage portal protein [Acetobacter nitrogenifigens DSM 23921 = NBRC 105050]